MSDTWAKDKVAVITGAGGTLCSCIAKHLAGLGAKVVLIGRTREKLEAVYNEIQAQNGVAMILTGDVTDENRMTEIGEIVKKEYGLCTLLINGAGGNQSTAMTTNTEFKEEELSPDYEGKSFFNLDMKTYSSVLETNTVGSVIPSRVFARHMIEAGGGAILNFASMNTYCPLTRVPAYAMAKAAISNFTEWLAGYLAPAKIRVNAVAPGFFVNERSVKFLGTVEEGLTARGAQVIAHTPAGRFGKAEDLLGTVDWLLNEEVSSFVSGITVAVDGGFLTRSGV